ncbi:MAG: L,D-transpeptidase family protein [Candidatus Omnitrophota bacterium]
MRRSIVYLFIIVGIVFIFMRFNVNSVRLKPKEKKEEAPYSQVMLNRAMQQKSGKPEEALKIFENIIVQFPQSKEAPSALIEMANIYKDKGQVLKQKEALAKLISSYSESALVAAAGKRLGQLNIDILFSTEKTSDSFLYEVQPGDNLYKIAKNNNTTVELLMKSNNLSDTLIRPGMKLKVNQAVFSIEIDKSEKTLTFLGDGEALKTYPIAVGADDSPTPVGQFKIVNRIVEPVWYKAGAIVPAGSPENILGSRWLGLSDPGYGIHGTVDSNPIVQQSTQGCIRMKNEDVEELFIIVPVGTQISIKD